MELAEKSVKSIAVIIVLYNGMPWIQQCLDSVLSSDTPVSIYLVDNASTDETVQWIEKEYHGRVKLHCSKVNLGFGRANNIALKQAYLDKFEFYFLLNQDCYVEPDTISCLLKKMIEFPSCFIASPIHLDGTGKALDKGFEAHLNEMYTPGFLRDYVGGKCLDIIYPVLFVNAAAWMVSIKCIEKIGLFNPSFFHYGEDANYINRLKYHNGMIGVYPFASIRHDRQLHSGNSMYKNERNTRRHNLLLKLSQPGSRYPVSAFLKNGLSGFFGGLISLNRKQLNRIYGEFTLFFSMKISYISQCNAASRKKGMAFFEETPSFTGNKQISF